MKDNRIEVAAYDDTGLDGVVIKLFVPAEAIEDTQCAEYSTALILGQIRHKLTAALRLLPLYARKRGNTHD